MKNKSFISMLCFFALLISIPSAAVAQVPYASPGNFYARGGLSVSVISVDGVTAPVPLDIYTPTAPGYDYPVIIFQHGYCGSKEGYQTILDHLASHGFITVAPTMYVSAGGMPCTLVTEAEEAALGVQLIAWLEANLGAHIPVNADTDLLGIAGHSRGGNTAYRMALDDPARIKALAGVDPVDGLEIFGQTPFVNAPLPLDLGIPTYILGTGLGPVPVNGFACAPEIAGQNHYFNANPRPSWHVVATENGHGDMVDEEDFSTFCPYGPNRDGMRSLTAGSLAAFFSGTLQGNTAALGLLEDPASAPVTTLMEKMTTRIQLASLTVALTDNDYETIVEWSTASEAGNTGFNVYRSESMEGPYTRLNSALIAPTPGGGDYFYIDSGLTPLTTYHYLLEDIDTSDNASRHGPVSARTACAIDITICSEPCEASQLIAFQICGDTPQGASVSDSDCDGVSEECWSLPEGCAPPYLNLVCDNCPDVANPGQEDADGDGFGDACDPVLISLAGFTARAGSRQVRLEWTTESEIDNAGFNLYRAEAKSGAYTRINDALIPARGAPAGGAAYDFLDTGLKNGQPYYYQLEDVDRTGTATRHGPVKAVPRLIRGLL